MNKTIFDKFFSIDELKASALVLVLFINIAAILVYLFVFGTIPQGLIELALSLIYSIAGVNALNGVKSAFGNSSNNDDSQSTNPISYNNIERDNEAVIDTSIKPKI